MEIRGDSWRFVEIRGDSRRFVEIRGLRRIREFEGLRGPEKEAVRKVMRGERLR